MQSTTQLAKQNITGSYGHSNHGEWQYRYPSITQHYDRLLYRHDMNQRYEQRPAHNPYNLQDNQYQPNGTCHPQPPIFEGLYQQLSPNPPQHYQPQHHNDRYTELQHHYQHNNRFPIQQHRSVDQYEQSVPRFGCDDDGQNLNSQFNVRDVNNKTSDVVSTDSVLENRWNKFIF